MQTTIEIGQRCPGCHVVCASFDVEHRTGCTYEGALKLVNPSYANGERVRAFHPRKLGVVNHGAVVKTGRKYVHVDFGALNGGTFKVAFRDIVERV